MPNIPNTIPIIVLTDSFSYPKIKFSIKTKKGFKVEINEANPLVMYFSAYVVKPLASTIIRIDNKKARENCLGLIVSNCFW